MSLKYRPEGSLRCPVLEEPAWDELVAVFAPLNCARLGHKRAIQPVKASTRKLSLCEKRLIHSDGCHCQSHNWPPL